MALWKIQMSGLFLFSAVFAWPLAEADIYYVNNQTGSDANTGRTAGQPFRTIRKALSSSGTSDTISLAGTGRPYRESVRLSHTGRDQYSVIEEPQFDARGLATRTFKLGPKRQTIRPGLTQLFDGSNHDTD